MCCGLSPSLLTECILRPRSRIRFDFYYERNRKALLYLILANMDDEKHWRTFNSKRPFLNWVWTKLSDYSLSNFFVFPHKKLNAKKRLMLPSPQIVCFSAKFSIMQWKWALHDPTNISQIRWQVIECYSISYNERLTLSTILFFYIFYNANSIFFYS